MWILPTNLPVNSPISASALVTEESISDFTESLDKNYEPSLLVRSKPSRWKTFLQKWKQGCYLRLRSGLTYAHSLGLTSKGLTYSAGGFLVSPSQRRESETPIAIRDTSSQQSLKESDTQSLDLFSWKTSKESCLPNSQEMTGATQRELQFCSMSSENWSEWVTEQRQAYSARVKSAHLTRGKESLSWPTASTRDHKGGYENGRIRNGEICLSTLDVAVQAYRETGMIGKKLYGRQSANVHAESMNALESVDVHSFAPDAEEPIPNADATAQRKTELNTNGETEFFMEDQSKHGQAAPANPSTHGSRQGLWATPSGYMNTNPAEEERNSMNLGMQAKQWATPRSCSAMASTITPESASNPNRFPNLETQVGRQWATPNMPDRGTRSQHKIAGNKILTEEGTRMRGLELPEQVKAWGTPSVTVTGGPTGLGGGSGNKKKMNALGPEGRAMCSGKLNPRWVETLMGLPIGWTMPSCIRPVTIEQTSCDCSAMESSQPPQSELF